MKIEPIFQVSDRVICLLSENPIPMTVKKLCKRKKGKFKGYVVCEWWNGKKWVRDKFNQRILNHSRNGYSYGLTSKFAEDLDS